MFRRFMIVCWVLFALFASLACVGVTGSNYHEYKILNIADFVIKPEHDEPIEIVQALQYGLDAVAELIRRYELREQQIVGAPSSPNGLPEGFVIDPPEGLPEGGDELTDSEIEKVKARGEVLSEKFNMAKEHERKIDSANNLAVMSGLAALAVLLWNIILHTGHWVWMGRKTE